MSEQKFETCTLCEWCTHHADCERTGEDVQWCDTYVEEDDSEIKKIKKVNKNA